MKFDVHFHGAKNGLGPPLPGFIVVDADSECEAVAKATEGYTSISHLRLAEHDARSLAEMPRYELSADEKEALEWGPKLIDADLEHLKAEMLRLQEIDTKTEDGRDQ